jgi:MFS family permease
MTRDLILVAMAMFTWGIGEGMFFYFQPLYLQQWGAAPVWIGVILSANGLAQAATQTPSGYLADRFGTRPLMWSAWIFGTLSAWIMAFANSLTVFVVGLVLFGFTSSSVAPMNTYIIHARGKWTVQRALTTCSAAFHFGMVLGPLAAGVIASRFGLHSIYWIAASIFIVSTAMILFARPQTPEHHAHIPSDVHLLRNGRFITLLVLIFLTVFATYLPQPLTPNFLQNQHQLGVEAIGRIGAVGSLGIALLSLAFGMARPLWGLLIGQVIVALAALVFRFGTNLPWFTAGYFLFGGYRLARSMILAFARPLIRPSEIGLAYGLIETTNACSIILAPFLAGLVYSIQPSGIYTLAFCLILVTILANLVFLPRLHPNPLPNQS